MEVKAQRTKGGVELLGRLPDDISNASTLEVFPLRDGMYLVGVKGALDRAHGTAAGSGPLTEPERALVKTLRAIRFEKRTPDEVDRALSPSEKATLSALMDRKVVNLFRSGKYENGVYNISDSIFGQARDVLPAHAQGTEAGASPPSSASAPSAAGKGTQPSRPAYDPLSKGYIVLDNEGDARQLSGAVAERIKAGEVAGLRAFDRKYYFIRKDFAALWQPKIVAALEKSDKTADELARALSLPPEACLAILLHMAEEGELLEKNKGKFALA